MERIDDLQLKGLVIIQDSGLFRFGTDAVLLADFAVIKKGARVVDLGAGTGILPLLMYGRQPDAAYMGVEIQESLFSLAQRSVELNGLAGSIALVHADMARAHEYFGGSNDVVVCNPPYEKPGEGAARGGESERIARKEVLVTFEQVAASAAALLKHGGSFYIIHRTSRLAEIITTLKSRGLEPKTMRMVHPKAGSEAKYVLMRSVKGAKEYMRVLPPLVLYGESGEETRELARIYRKNI